MAHTAPAQQNNYKRTRRGCLRRGFTLAEVMVALPLVMLLFGGTITLFLESQRLVQRTGVTVQSSQDAGVGQRFITGTTREAIQFSLPPDTTSANTNGLAFLPPDGNLNDYHNVTQSGSINTAVELLLPAAAASVKNTGQAATLGLNLLDRSGNPVTPSAYDRTQAEVSGGVPVSPLAGDILCLYRGDAAGNASPAAGQFLWSVRRPAGTSLYDSSHDIRQKLCRLILTQHADGTPATDAVQFIGCRTPGTDIPSSMPYELEFKLICGDRTSINGTQTNEAGDGSSITALSGRCALLRNHN